MGRSGGRAERSVVLDETLRASVHRISGRDARFWGWALGTVRKRTGLSPDGHAAALGLTPSAYALLALCWRPRHGREAEDLAAVAEYAGMDVGVLDGLLAEAATTEECG